MPKLSVCWGGVNELCMSGNSTLAINQAVKDAIELAKLVQLTGRVCSSVGPEADSGLSPSS